MIEIDGRAMSARHWRGWTKVENADAYEDLLTRRVSPNLKKTAGYSGGYPRRKDSPQDVAFVVFESV